MNRWHPESKIRFHPRYLLLLVAPLITMNIALGGLVSNGPSHFWPITYPQGEWWWGVTLAALIGVVGLVELRSEPVKRFETLLIHEFCATSSRATGGLIHATSGSCGAAGGRCRNRMGLAA